MQTNPTAPGDGTVAELDRLITAKNAVELIQVADERFDGAPIVQVASVPAGRKLESLRPYLDEFLPTPLRRRGTATVQTERAFLELVRRLQGPSSAVFADPAPTAPSVTAVLNYHEPATTEEVAQGTKTAGWNDHRVKFACRMSDEWKAWLGVHEKMLDQVEFAEFLHDRIEDCILVDSGQEPKIGEIVETLQANLGGPSALRKLARGLEVRQGIATKAVVTLESGEIEAQFVDQHLDADGKPLRTPNLFFITIPVFYAGPAYRIPVRLRYRLSGGGIRWGFVLYRHDKVFEHAFDELLNKVRSELALEVFVGAPEA